MIKCCKTSYKATHTYTLFRISDILDYLYNCPFLLIKVTEVTGTYFLGWFDSLYGLWLSFIYFFCRPLLSSYRVRCCARYRGHKSEWERVLSFKRQSTRRKQLCKQISATKNRRWEREGWEGGRREEGRDGRGGEGREGRERESLGC